MYAAAGGASLASRQKRKNQAAQNVKNKALLQQGLKDKLAASRASSLAAPTKAQSRQFHNLPSSYLRTPQAQVRKLSAGYTSQSRILLPINESNNQYFAQHHQHHKHETSQQNIHHSQHPHHHHHHHHHHHPNQLVASHPSSAHPILSHELSHPHSLRSNSQCLHAHKHLTKSATASIPLVSQYESTTTPSPGSPTRCIFKHHFAPVSTVDDVSDNNKQKTRLQSPTKILQIPCDDIIVTPATPLPSPGPPTADQLERKCSFYRGRKQLAYEESLKKSTNDELLVVASAVGHEDLQYNDEYHAAFTCDAKQAVVVDKLTESDYCDSEHRHIDVCTCDHIEVKCTCQMENGFKRKVVY